MKTRKFSMSQTDLYSIGEHVLDKTAANLSAFTAKIPKYDADYLAAIRAKLNDAQNKPAHTERVEAPKAARQELLELHTDCLAKWQELKRAIMKDETKSYIIKMLIDHGIVNRCRKIIVPSPVDLCSESRLNRFTENLGMKKRVRRHFIRQQIGSIKINMSRDGCFVRITILN